MDDSIIETAVLKTLKKFEKLREEKRQLEKRTAEVEQEIAMLRPKIIALSSLMYEEPPANSPIGEFLKQLEQMGLTDAIREVLKASNDFMTPVEVRDALIKMGYDIKKYGNILASIHTILKRLLNAGELIFTLRDKDGKVGYKWHATLSERIAEIKRNKVIDLFSGQGSVPTKRGTNILKKIAEAEKPKIIYKDPPYVAAKKGKK